MRARARVLAPNDDKQAHGLGSRMVCNDRDRGLHAHIPLLHSLTLMTRSIHTSNKSVTRVNRDVKLEPRCSDLRLSQCGDEW